jgi:hypothetical protein
MPEAELVNFIRLDLDFIRQDLADDCIGQERPK